MTRIILLASLVLTFNFIAFAQAPNAVKYQAVARDGSGSLLLSQQVGLRLSILDNSASGTIVYQERHAPNTNAYGLFTIDLGAGTVLQGNFTTVNWGSGSKYLKIELDPAGGTNYSEMGVTQLVSVPYALYAESAGNVSDAIQSLTLSGNVLTISNGNSITLPGSYTAGAGIGIVNNTITNTAPDQMVGLTGTGISTVTGTYPNFTVNTSAQSLSLNNNVLSISNGNSVTLPGGSGGAYVAGTGINISGNTITNTAPDQTVAITGSGITTVTGAYPNFNITSAQVPQVLSLAGNDLSLSNGGGTITLPTGGGGTYTAGTGISVSGNVITNTAPNQVVSITGAGTSSVTGTYPNFTVTSAQTPQVLSLAGNNLSLSNGGGTVALPSGGSLNDAYNFGGAGAGKLITANAGPVEINTSTNNAAALRVTHSTSGVGVQVISNSASNLFSTLQASTASTNNTVSAITGSTTGGAYAVAGQVEASATAFAAVYGSNLRTAGGVGVEGAGFNGIAGTGSNVLGFGAFGENIRVNLASRPNNLAAGVNGIGFVGTLGQTQTNDGSGVLGVNLGNIRNGTFDNAGVEGQGFTGVLGQTNTPNIGYGVLSGGDIGGTGGVLVLGNLSAGGTKNFVIDHPSDPAHKFLRHFSLESNEVLNMYRGTIQLDNNGEAVIELPNYFESVNKEFSYHLTPVGAPASGLFVKSEIQNNRFTIAGGQPGLKVSWQVIAERNDPYLVNHPDAKDDQPMKPAHQVGKYVHPAEYGKGTEDAIIRVNGTPQKNILRLNEQREGRQVKMQ